MRVRWLPFGCFLIFLAIPCLAALGLWVSYLQRTTEHRFRITIEVETPEGPKRGASVWSVTCTLPINRGGWSFMTGGTRVVGEAIFVDLGQGRNLMGLMAHGPTAEGLNSDIAADAFQQEGVPKNQPWCPYAPKWNGFRLLRGNLIPTLATFADLNDPASGRVVPATDVGFYSIFGPGYRLESVTLEMVPVGVWPLNLIGLWGTPITHGIEQQIPFLVSHREQLRNVQRNMPPRFQTGFMQFVHE